MALRVHADPAEALAWLRGRDVSGSLRSDSRALRPGDAFFAWPGRQHDARRQVAAALAGGVGACLVEADGAADFAFDDPRISALRGLKAAAGPLADAWHGQPSAKLDVVAITGTNGKTSSACWIATALAALNRPCGVIGTLGVGMPGAIEAGALTTPDALTLQSAFARFVERGATACTVEASSIGLVEHRLAGSAIRVALFTNFTQDHLDVHASMQAYWAAKRSLFDWPGLAAAVVNIDDAQGALLAGELAGRTGLDLWTCSLRNQARLQGSLLRYVEGALAFDVVEGDQRHAVHSGLVGEHNAHNLLGVIGALRALGVSLADATQAMGLLEPVPGRLEQVGGANADAPLAIVDYAHTPDALEQTLRALRPLADARSGALWCVFGCGGDRDPVKRPLMGAIAARDADHVVLTSDNPRSESPGHILAQILVGMPRQEAVDVIEDRAAAIGHALRSAAAADIVLIAGKGHEDYQEVAGVRRPFSDAAVAAAVLHERMPLHEGAAL